MRCVICHSTDKWENVDDYRLAKKGMSICRGCGFISYPEKYKSKAEILEYYRKAYRPAPQAGNLFSGQRKLNYHGEFLADLFSTWKQAGKKDPSVLEIGSAYGLVLAWFRQIRDGNELLFPGIKLHGTELTKSYRRNAWHEFQVRLDEDFDDNLKHDLIMSYKVAEHMLDVDLEFKRYRASLKDDGFLYISVPTWFGRLNNFGAGGWDIEYYYHPDHINVWSEKHFRYLLGREGFKIVKENHSIYDSTYLCVKGEYLDKPEYDGYNATKEKLARVKEADACIRRREFGKAIDFWPNFPFAWRAYYESERANFGKKGLGWIIDNVVKPCIAVDTTCSDYYSIAADIHMRYDRYDEAIGYIKKGLECRPNCDQFLTSLANAYRALAKKTPGKAEKIHFLTESRNITRHLKNSNFHNLAENLNWLYADNAELPTPFE